MTHEYKPAPHRPHGRNGPNLEAILKDYRALAPGAINHVIPLIDEIRHLNAVIDHQREEIRATDKDHGECSVKLEKAERDCSELQSDIADLKSLWAELMAWTEEQHRSECLDTEPPSANRIRIIAITMGQAAGWLTQ
jgi:hypothetical protein